MSNDTKFSPGDVLVSTSPESYGNTATVVSITSDRGPFANVTLLVEGPRLIHRSWTYVMMNYKRVA